MFKLSLTWPVRTPSGSFLWSADIWIQYFKCVDNAGRDWGWRLWPPEWLDWSSLCKCATSLGIQVLEQWFSWIDPLSRGHLERFSEGFWSWECVLFHPDALGPHLISFVNAPWFLCTFVSRNSNSYLEDCSWATEACFVPLRRMRRLIHETW